MSRLPFDGDFPITQAFGVVDPRYTELRLKGHNGVDFGLPLHTRLLAPADGEAIEVGYAPGGFGYYVKLRTPSGEDWLLAHMEHYHLPEPGEWLAEGAHLGFSGSSGMSTGPHLHLGYRPQWWVRGWPYDGYVDPEPQFLPF